MLLGGPQQSDSCPRRPAAAPGRAHAQPHPILCHTLPGAGLRVRCSFRAIRYATSSGHLLLCSVPAYLLSPPGLPFLAESSILAPPAHPEHHDWTLCGRQSGRRVSSQQVLGVGWPLKGAVAGAGEEAGGEGGVLQATAACLAALGVPLQPSALRPHLPKRPDMPDLLCQLLLLQERAFVCNTMGQHAEVSAVLMPRMHGLLAYLGSLLQVGHRLPLKSLSSQSFTHVWQLSLQSKLPGCVVQV